MAVILRGSYYSTAALWNDALSSGKSRFLGCFILGLSCDGEGASCCCRLASNPPHKTQQDDRAEPSRAGWIIHLPSSSTPAMERLWLVSTQILLIILCVPLRQARRDTKSLKKKIRPFCLNSNTSCAVAAGLGHRASSSPPSSCPFLSLRWVCLPRSVMLSDRGAYMLLVHSVVRVAVFLRRVALRCAVAEQGPVYLKVSRVDTGKQICC